MYFYSYWILDVSLAMLLWNSIDLYMARGGRIGEITLHLNGRSVSSDAAWHIVGAHQTGTEQLPD